jgi:hypothetical protein
MMATPKKRTDIEWVDGVMAMPAYVTGEGGPPYRPEALFWIDMNGRVIGHAVGVPGEVLVQACESLRSTIERPVVGRPHTPDRVRVASPVLAEAPRSEIPTLDVVCAPTPELDALNRRPARPARRPTRRPARCGEAGDGMASARRRMHEDGPARAVGRVTRHTQAFERPDETRIVSRPLWREATNSTAC